RSLVRPCLMPRWRTWSRTSLRPISSCANGRTRSSSTPSSASASNRSRSASMRLVRGGRVVADRYLRVLDDAPIPDNVPVIIPAARSLADAAEVSRREAPTGVLWPNNRRISELVPHLDRLALVALVFPTFKDGRAYSQARQLREQHGFRGELRATGNVLRDQFLFLVRAGSTSFESGKEPAAPPLPGPVGAFSGVFQPAATRRAPGPP